MKDKYKDIKKYLNRAYWLTQTRDKLEREYEKKQKEVGNISVSNSEIKSNKIVSNVENKAIELISLKNNIDLHNIKIEELKKEISCVISRVEDENLRDLLRLRYIEFRKWEDIAYILHYSRRNVFYARDRALKEVEKILKDCTALHF